MDSTPNPIALTLRCKAQGHLEYPSCIEIISAAIDHPQYGNIGSLKAWRIYRSRCPGAFLRILDQDNSEMHTFSITLFDKFGHARPELVNPGYRSGTGCWGRELDSGALVYILGFNIRPAYRGQGIGTRALSQFLASEHVKIDDIVICWPSPSRIHDRCLWSITRSRQIAFFRKNHFRRIGRTNFFGYSPKQDHPSRAIAMENDIGALDHDFPASDLGAEERKFRYPLLYAVAEDKSPSVAAVIQACYERDPESIRRPDEKGFTPIFGAATCSNLHAVRKLLEWDMRAELQSTSNAEGVTPLERLADTMRSTREFSETYLGWDGYSDQELTIEYLLKKATPGQVVNATNISEYIAGAKYGCTCNQCAGGWLSPRMRFRLHFDAVFWADSMPMNFERFPQGQIMHPSDMMDGPSDFIPPALHPSFYLSFYKGLCGVMRAIANHLESTTRVLSVEGVLAFVKPNEHSQYFFKRGGRIEHAFDSITNNAEDQSELGDDTFWEYFGEDEAWLSLPTCANDLEFELVRKMIGLDARQQWGPYRKTRAAAQEKMEVDTPSDEDEVGDEDESDDEDIIVPPMHKIFG
ncbi:ankyrin repeat family protein [Favolaschia claudopus]|uniref:Ankyrin repeat family protein n=1 Tax=Favolaschia claudopus TaxID=2862362 RepID=A0AAW0DXA1_9AGAR